MPSQAALDAVLARADAALPDSRTVVLPGIDHFRVTSEFACIDAVLAFLDLAP